MTRSVEAGFQCPSLGKEVFLEPQLLLSVGLEMDSRFLVGFSLNWFWQKISCSTSPDSLTKVVVCISQYTNSKQRLSTLNAKNSCLVAFSLLHKSNSIICCLTYNFNVKFNVYVQTLSYVQWIVALHMVTIPYKHRKHFLNFKKSLWSRQFDF